MQHEMRRLVRRVPRRPLRATWLLLVAMGAIKALSIALGGHGQDMHAYYAAYAASGDLYTNAVVGGVDAYLYSPAFAQALAPLQALPWEWFRVAWDVAGVAAFVWLLGPFALFALMLPPVYGELTTMNIHFLLAVVAAAGLRRPGLWSLALLTKVTPGVAITWFAVRREWRNLGIALAVTGAVAGISLALNPGLWVEWIGLLANPGSGDIGHLLVAIPLAPRLVTALVLVAWGAHTDRRWTVPIAVTLALPVLWIVGLSTLTALGPELRRMLAAWLTEPDEARLPREVAVRIERAPAGAQRPGIPVRVAAGRDRPFGAPSGAVSFHVARTLDQEPSQRGEQEELELVAAG